MAKPSEDETLVPDPSVEDTLWAGSDVDASGPPPSADDTLAVTGSEGASPSSLARAFVALGAGLSQPHPPPSEGERYSFDALLGRGGMGEVWRVSDRHLERDVALKRMRSRDAKPEALARFLREAQLSGSLEHPNIVPIYDLGVDSEGAMFFTMRRLRGRSLAELLEAGELGSQLERLTIFRKVCDAMAFAHARGVIHRDLKPDNVMVGEYGEVMVLDWGLAKRLDERTTGVPTGPPLLMDSSSLAALAQAAEASLAPADGEDSESSTLTHAGALMGTPAFMSPEQALGQTHLVDTRTDIYALGILLYVLLTGERPFRGQVAALLFQISQGQFDPPSARAEVPRELEAIVLEAMAREPERRYASVAAPNSDIQAYLERRPVSVVRYRAWQRAQKWAGRNRRTVIAAATTGALGLAALFVGGSVYLRDVASARDRAEQARGEALSARDQATSARDQATAARDHANASEREAQLHAGEAEVGLALALARGGDFIEAAARLDAARASFGRAGADTLAAELVDSWIDGENPPPVMSYSFGGGFNMLAASRDHQLLAVQLGSRLVVDDWISGQRRYDQVTPGLVERALAPRGDDDFVVLVRNEGGVEVRSLLGDALLATLPDGATLRMCTGGETVLIEGEEGLNQLWSVETGAPLGPRFDCGRVHSASADCGRIACDPTRAPSYKLPPAIEVWDARAGRKRWALPPGNTKNISADGRLMLISFEHQGVSLWDLDTGELLWRDEDSARTGSGYFSPDNQRIYAYTTDRWVHWWTREGEWLGERRVDGNLLPTPAGDPYLITSRGGRVEIRTDAPGAHEVFEPPPESGRIWNAAVEPHERLGLSAGRMLSLFDPLTGASSGTLSPELEVRARVALDARGRALVTTVDGRLDYYDLRESSDPGSERVLELGDKQRITGSALRPGHDQAVISDSQGRLLVWDFSADAVVARHELDMFIWSFELSADGRLAYLAGRREEDPVFIVVEVETGAKVFASPVLGPGYSVSATRDGSMFAGGPHRGTLDVFGPGASEPLVELETLGEPIMGLTFAPRGELLAAASYSGQLLLWRSHDWSSLPSLPIGMPNMRFGPDGNHLIGAQHRFFLDLAARGEALALGFPAAAGETRSSRMSQLIAALVLQHAWAAADQMIERAREEGLAVDELLAARIAWRLEDRPRALAALERVDAGALAEPAMYEVLLRLIRG